MFSLGKEYPAKDKLQCLLWNIDIKYEHLYNQMCEEAQGQNYSVKQSHSSHFQVLLSTTFPSSAPPPNLFSPN